MGRSDGIEGFVVHSFTRTAKGATQVCLIGRLSDGRSFAAVIPGVEPTLHVRASDKERAAAVATPLGASLRPSEMRTMDGEQCLALPCPTPTALNRLAEALAREEVRTYEADLRTHDLFLMDRGVHGSLTLTGEIQKGRRVDALFINPVVGPSGWEPRLFLLSLDIETNPFGREIYAVALSWVSPSREKEEEVFLARSGAEKRPRGPADPSGAPGGEPPIRRYATEREMLAAFAARLVELDPDVIVGWNVIDFDFARIIERFKHHGLSLALGRSGEPCTYLPGAQRKPSALILAGRQVLDGVRLVRSGPQRFADQSLEAVAQEVLGYGKEITATRGRAKLEEIQRLYRDDPAALCRYCLADARLVLEILDRTGLMVLTLKRCSLIGVSLSRAWTSIAAFDSIYIEAMHRRGIVAPTLGVDALPLTEAPGGAIITPLSGLYDNVYVFDFQSLYPSIIRTFNIDPVSYIPDSLPDDRAGSPEPIRAPNGARFRREPGLLPELLGQFFESRSEAKRAGDQVASFVFKIVMNSFYGVLGASGCRFAGSDLAGAITGLGHHILYWCRDFLASQGLRTLYGDTDSLFVQSGLPAGTKGEAIRARGAELCSLVNRELARHLTESYGVEPRLLLQFEKTYSRFFVPPLRARGPLSGRELTADRSSRGEPGAEPPRGRAKGYAGAILGEEGAPIRIEVKGMEAARRDWTDAAKRFQLEMLRLVFERLPAGEIVRFVRSFLTEIADGRMDDSLVYTKALRKAVDEYASSIPAHVRAARYLDAGEQSGLIDYLWTKEGPQPVGATTAPIDYDHYLEKQIKPIAAAFSEVIGVDLEELFHRDRQLPLF